jgi:hypothetical protein
MGRLAVSVIQPAPVAPQLERMARGDAVRVRRDVRDGVRRPVPGVARGDSSRIMVPPGTFRLEHDVPAGKSNGELFPTAFQSKFKTASHAKPSTPRILGTCFDRVNMSN